MSYSLNTTILKPLSKKNPNLEFIPQAMVAWLQLFAWVPTCTSFSNMSSAAPNSFEIVSEQIGFSLTTPERKMSQNKTVEDHQSSIDGLRTMNTLLSSVVADEMELDK